MNKTTETMLGLGREPEPDVTVEVEDAETLYLFRLHSDAARDWVDQNVTDDGMFWCGALICEPRYAAELAAGMVGDGLIVR